LFGWHGKVDREFGLFEFVVGFGSALVSGVVFFFLKMAFDDDASVVRESDIASYKTQAELKAGGFEVDNGKMTRGSEVYFETSFRRGGRNGDVLYRPPHVLKD